MEKINAVDMVRKIRDSQHEQTKGMSKSEYLKYVKVNGGKALKQMKGMVHKQRVAA